MSIWSSIYPIGVFLEQCQTLITDKWIYYNVINVSRLISMGPIWKEGLCNNIKMGTKKKWTILRIYNSEWLADENRSNSKYRNSKYKE